MWYSTRIAQHKDPDDAAIPDSRFHTHPSVLYPDLVHFLSREAAEEQAAEGPGGRLAHRIGRTRRVSELSTREAGLTKNPYAENSKISHMEPGVLGKGARRALGAQELDKDVLDTNSINTGLKLGTTLQDHPEFTRLAQVYHESSPEEFPFMTTVQPHLPQDATPQQRLAIALTKGWKRQPNQQLPFNLALQHAAADEFPFPDGPPSVEHLKGQNNLPKSQQLYADHDVALRAFLRAQYDATQKHLQEQGITSVPLMRGVNWTARKNHKHMPDYMQNAFSEGPGEVKQHPNVPVHTAPLSSHTVYPRIAHQFGQGDNPTAYKKYRYGGMYMADVPSERIMSLPDHGLGAMSQGEAVVLGGPMNVNMISGGQGAFPYKFDNTEHLLTAMPPVARPAPTQTSSAASKTGSRVSGRFHPR